MGANRGWGTALGSSALPALFQPRLEGIGGQIVWPHPPDSIITESWNDLGWNRPQNPSISYPCRGLGAPTSSGCPGPIHDLGHLQGWGTHGFIRHPKPGPHCPLRALSIFFLSSSKHSAVTTALQTPLQSILLSSREGRCNKSSYAIITIPGKDSISAFCVIHRSYWRLRHSACPHSSVSNFLCTLCEFKPAQKMWTCSATPTAPQHGG